MQQDQACSSSVAMHVASAVALLIDLVLLAMAGYLATCVRPNFVKLIEDFDAELPAITLLTISVPGILLVAVFLGIAAFLALKEILVPYAAVKLGVNLVAGLAVLAFAAVFYLSLLMPLSQIIQQVGS